MTQEQIRRANSRRLALLTRAEEKRDAIKRKYDAEWQIIEASRHNEPGRKLDRDRYIDHKLKLGDLENALEKAEHAVSVNQYVFDLLPIPKPRRPRKTVLVNGIRTKIERRRTR
jgi:hypothetical protein